MSLHFRLVMFGYFSAVYEKLSHKNYLYGKRIALNINPGADLVIFLIGSVLVFQILFILKLTAK